MDKEFVRVRSKADIIISVTLVAAGCLLILIPSSVSVNIAGFLMICAGILLAIMLKSAYMDTETQEVYRKKEKFFPQSCKNIISLCLANAIEDLSLESEDTGNGLRLDMYFSPKRGTAYLRLYEYVPYKYEAASPVYEYPIEKIDKLLK